MKRYELRILHPGMSRYTDIVWATHFKILDESIFFYEEIDPNQNEFEAGEERYKVKCVYPASVTIIEKIEE